jgi:hypothetical protein
LIIHVDAAVEKPTSKRLMENVHMQGFRDPEERGVSIRHRAHGKRQRGKTKATFIIFLLEP